MPAIVPIVEGGGEEEAFPPLLRRLLYEQDRYDFTVTSPYNAQGRTKLTRSGGIEAYLSYAASEPDAVGIIVLLDLEDDNCAADLARELAARTRNVGLNLPVAIVVVVQAYEAWFIASIETIRGQPIKGLTFLPDDIESPPEPETIRSPKEWLKRATGCRSVLQGNAGHGPAYRATRHAPVFASAAAPSADSTTQSKS